MNSRTDLGPLGTTLDSKKISFEHGKIEHGTYGRIVNKLSLLIVFRIGSHDNHVMKIQSTSGVKILEELKGCSFLI